MMIQSLLQSHFDDDVLPLILVKLWRINEVTFRFRVFNKQFVGLDGINAVAVTKTSTNSETFHVVKESESSSRVRIKASNGYFLQVIIFCFLFFLCFFSVKECIRNKIN